MRKLLILALAGLVALTTLGTQAGSRPRGDIRHDRRDIRRDLRDLRGDRRDIRSDRRDLRRDRRDLRHDRWERRRGVGGPVPPFDPRQLPGRSGNGS